MNAPHLLAPLASRAPATVPSCFESPLFPAANNDRYRERDFGIGYGASSGYALDKRYTSDWGQARFRCR
jgi:hypothetical protein